MNDADRLAEIKARWAAMDVSAVVPQEDVDWLLARLEVLERERTIGVSVVHPGTSKLTEEQWLRITQIHELVKQEGDARCEAAFDDLIGERNRVYAENAVLRAALTVPDE